LYYLQKLGKLRTQYNKSLHEELDEIQDLKTDLSKLRRDLKQAEKMCKECESKNKSIVEPFTKAKDSLEVLNKDAKEFNQEKSKLERKKAELKVDEKKLKDLQWRHEVLFQKYELLEREYIDTKEKLAESKLENQQRCSMNDMILLKKISDVDDIANDHILVLSKMLAKDHDIKPLKIECGGNLNEKETSLSIDGLDRMQSEMQRLHNAFIGRRSATIGHSVIPEDVAIL
jgi:chromosome segregation ATPase